MAKYITIGILSLMTIGNAFLVYKASGFWSFFLALNVFIFSLGVHYSYKNQ